MTIAKLARAVGIDALKTQVLEAGLYFSLMLVHWIQLGGSSTPPMAKIWSLTTAVPRFERAICMDAFVVQLFDSADAGLMVSINADEKMSSISREAAFLFILSAVAYDCLKH